MGIKHVFLSYVREDKAAVDELQSVLEEADFEVWRDTDKLWPGEDWKAKIRAAIKDDAMVFVACFSTRVEQRDKSYQNEELTIATDEYRLRPAGSTWLMTVRLDECAIPKIDLGGGRYLDETIHRADIFGDDKIKNITRLVTAINRTISGAAGGAGEDSQRSATAFTQVQRDNESSASRLRRLLRDPNGDLEFDEHVRGLRSAIVDQLSDRDVYPLSGAVDARTLVDRVRAYESTLLPYLPELILFGAFGKPEHALSGAALLRAIGAECHQGEGTQALIHVHEYPAVLSMYALTLGALYRRQFWIIRALIEEPKIAAKRGGRFGAKSSFVGLGGQRTIFESIDWVGSILTYEDDQSTAATDEVIEDFRLKRRGNRYTPVSDHIHQFLRPLLADYYPDQEGYDEAFDLAEIFLDAIAAYVQKRDDLWATNVGYGRYTWRARHGVSSPDATLLEEAKGSADGWTPVLEGVFGGSSEAAVEALTKVHELAQYLRDRRW